MNCWEELGIAPRSDKKTIKIAYAKRLKQTRPDEDPEGFQRLHRAYKDALSWEDYEYYEDESSWDDGSETSEEISECTTRHGDESTVTTEPVENATSSLASNDSDKADSTVLLRTDGVDEDVSDNAPLVESTLPSPESVLEQEVLAEATSQSLSPEDQQLLEDIREQENALSDSWESFRQQVNTLVCDHKACNKVENWAFLKTMPAMRDLEFRKSAADNLFEVVAELNEESLLKKSLYIKRPVINYLNDLFQWDKHWQEYEYRYSRSTRDGVFPYLAESEKVVKGSKLKREIHYYRRVAAFAIDIAILFVVGLVISSIGDNLTSTNDGFEWAIHWALFYTLVLIPIQESSLHQATIGKRVLGLQVINSQGDRINFFHAFGRSVATLFCCALFKIVFLINMALSWWKNELLQDIVSRSYVCMKRKSN